MEIKRSWIIGYSVAVLSVLLISISAACTQVLDRSVPITEILCGQFLAQLLFSLPSLVYRAEAPVVRGRQLAWVGGIVLMKLTAHWLLYIGSTMGPAGTLQATFTSCVTVVCMIRDVIKQRRCSLSIWSTLLLCLLGLVMTSQPTFLGFPEERHNHTSPCQEETIYDLPINSSTLPASSATNVSDSSILSTIEGPLLGGTLTGLTGVICGFTFIICDEYLQDVNINIVNFWTGVVNSSISLILLGVFQTPVFPVGVLCWFMLLGVVFPDGLATNLMYISVLLITPTPVSVLLTLNIVFVTIFQYTVLKDIHPGHRNWVEVVGLLLLTAANALYPYLSWREKKKQNYDNIE